MLTTKRTSVKRVIEGVYRDFGFEDSLKWSDAVEWIGEAMDLIGAHMQYNTRVTDGKDANIINIANYRGSLPCDLHRIIQTREYCNKTPMLYAQDTFHTAWHCSGSVDLTCNATNCVTKATDDDGNEVSTIADDNFCNPFFNFNPTPTSNSGYSSSIVDTNLVATNLTYQLNNDFIFTNFKSGQVEMAYLAFPTDEDGYPLVPEEQSYIEALKYYIAWKIAFKLNLLDKINDSKLFKIEQQKDWYIAKSHADASFPSLDEMEGIKNSWLRSIPKITEHNSFFEYNQDPELRVQHSNRR